MIYKGGAASSNRDWAFGSTNGQHTSLRNSGSGTLTLTGGLSAFGGYAGANMTLYAETGDIAMLGVISSVTPRRLIFQAATGRTITLGDANTYAGPTTIIGTVKAGTLANVGSVSSFGTGVSTSTITLNNGTLSYTGAGSASNRTIATTGTANAINNDGTGALSLTGNISLVVNGTLTLGGGGSFAGTNTLSGTLSGAGNLAVDGAGTWMLSGNNIFTGSATVQSGTLAAGSVTAFSSANPLVVNGGTLALNGFNVTARSLAGTGGTVDLGGNVLTLTSASGNTSYAGSIVGSGGLTKLGTSTQTLTGQNTYTGATTIGGGTLTLNFAGTGAPASDIISASSALFMSGGTLNLTGADNTANSQTFGALTVTGGSNRINATASGTGTMTVDLGLISRNGGLVDFGIGAGVTMLADNGDGELGGWATINGQDYVQVQGGVLTAFADYDNKDNAADWQTNDIVSDEGGTANTPFTGTVNGNVQLGGLKYTAWAHSEVTVGDTNTLGVDGAIIVSPGVGNTNQTIQGGFLTGGAGGGVLGVLQNSAGTFTIASTIVDNGGATGFSVAGRGTGTVVLTGDNSYTGATTVAGGATLSIDSVADAGTASAIGAASTASSNLLIEGGRLVYTGGTASTNRGFTIATSGAATAGTIHVELSTANLTFGGVVTSPDTAGLIKTGAGTLTLSNDANDYTGVTTISGGTLAVDTLADGGAASGIGASSSDSANLVLETGGELEYTGADGSTNRGFTLGTGGGAIDVAQGTTTLTVSGVAAGTASLTKNGAGTLVLSGVNTYSGGTIVNDGILRAGSTQAFGSATGLMTVNAGGTLDLNGYNNQVGGLAGNGNVTLGSITSPATLTLNPGSGTFSGTISGAGGVTKVGAGTQTMVDCKNDYKGATTIGGTLSTNCLADGGDASGIGASSADSSNLNLLGGRLSYTGASISINRGFTLAGGNGFIEVTDAGTTLEFEGIVAGGGTLLKEGGGTLVLSGANTYNGNTRVIGGVLRAGTTNAFGPSGHMTLDNTAGVLLDLDDHDTLVTSLIGGGANGGNVDLGSATLTIRAVDNRSYAGAIGGTGNLVMTANNAARVQELTGCGSTYDGTTTISSGVLAVSCLNNGDAASSIGDSSAAASNLVLNGGTLRYIGAGGSTDRLFTLGASSDSKIEASGTGTIAFTNTGAIAFASAGTNQTIRLGGTNTGNNSFALQIADNAGGVTSFTKEDAGTWILNNSGSTYTGVTSILGGVLGVDKLADGGEASSIGRSSADAGNLVIGSGSTLRYTGAGDSTNRLFTLDAGVTFIESSGTGAIAFTNTGTMGFAGSGTRIFALGGSNTGMNIMGVSITDGAGGATTLSKADAGNWYLTGNSTYTGPTNINAGTLFIGDGGTSGSITSNTVNVTGLGALGFNRSDEVTYAGTIQGSGGVTQAGTGTTILTGTNTYTGGTTISAGTLQLGNGGLTGSIVGDVVNNGTLVFNRAGVYTFAGMISGTGAVVMLSNSNTTLSGTNTYTGGTTLNAGMLRVTSDANLGDASGGLTFNGGALDANATFTSGRSINLVGDGTISNSFGLTLTLTGTISGAGALTKTSSGTLILTGDNSYTGGTTIHNNARFQIGNGGATGSIVGDVVIGSSAATLAVNRSGTLTLDGTISGTGRFIQSGPGTTILTGANTYAGTTTVSAGTLLVNGNQLGATGLTSVASGATLGGSGTIGGDVTFLDGTLAPGSNGVGTLTIKGDLTLSGGTTLDYEFGQSDVVGGPLNDLLEVEGNLTLAGEIDVTVSPGGNFGPGLYRVISYGGTLDNQGLAIGSMPAGSTVAVQTSIDGQVNLVNAAGGTFNFWDGADPANESNNFVDGGSGTWQSGSGNNDWTTDTGVVSGAYTDGAFAIFAAAAGTVDIDNSLGAVTASGLQFATDGYTITGEDLALIGPQSIVRVGDGTAAGLDMTATLAVRLTGNTQLVKSDLGTLVLSGDNAYTGGTLIEAGTLRISSDANLGDASGALVFDGGALNTTADITSARNVTMIGNGTFVTDAGTSLVFTGALTGSGNLIKDGAGILALNDTSDHTGTTTVRAGSLFINGDLSQALGLTSVASGSTLGGSGIIGGDVIVADGATLAPGNSPGTLTINGDLALSGGSVLDFEFGEANVVGGSLNDLVNIGGDLILDGTINVTVSAGGSFGPGIYRVFNYGGTLTDNGLDIGTMPGGSTVSVQTAITGQVNLVNSAGLTLSFWDGDAGPKNNGAVNGGDGVWRVGGGSSNWADMDGTVNGDYAQDSFAIFSAAPGTVRIDNVGGAVQASGLQFASDGYTIRGDALTLTGTSAIVQVGDGGTTSSGYSATIEAELTGAAQLVKTDAGTLILTADNSYTGGTAINGGTVRISHNLALGDDGGALSFGGGTLNTTADMAMIRNVNLVGSGTFDVDAGTLLTVNGLVSGGGALVKNGAGVMVLTADNGYTGGTTINSGILQVGSGTSGAITGNVVNNAQLAFARSDNVTFGGAISGGGSVSHLGAGVLTLTGNNSYTGITTIDSVNGGTLQLGDGGTTGSIAGDVVNDGTLAFNRSDAVIFGGTISGSGAVSQIGTGTTILTADNSYGGGTVISAGVLQLGNGGTTGSIVGDVTNNAMLMFNRSDVVTFGGTISGSGLLHQFGSGTTILTGANSYSGDTVVSGGTLLINGDQSLATGPTNVLGGGMLGGTGTIGGDVFVGGGAILAPGSNGVGVLTINGNLDFSPNGLLNVELGQANVPGGPFNDLINVGGDLTLDGTINVTQAPGGTFGPGVYRIFNYSGTLTDDGLTIGSLPSGTAFVQTAIANQVNLVNTAGLTLNFWDGEAGPKNDGAIQGGDGVWRVGGGQNNWTEFAGTVNADYAQDSFAIFQGTGGTVTIDDDGGDVLASGLQFTSDGYEIAGDALTLTGTDAFVRVGDGSPADAGLTATISAELTGSAGLVKDFGGTLVLTAANTYTGGTAINGGTLRISSDANLGDTAGDLSFNGGTLHTVASIASARAVELAGAGSFLTDAGTTLTLDGLVSGVGALTKDGAGSLILTNANTYAGGTTINAGTLQLGNGGTSGSIAGNVANNGVLAFNRADSLTFAGTISGSGAVNQIGGGTTTLTGDNSYTGATAVTGGTLLINGNQGAATGETSVASGATLGGTGVIGGNVTLADGATLTPGAGGAGTLTINGNLALSGGSQLAYDFGAANAPGDPLNDVVNVGGDLTLDGTINVAVSPGGSFDIGLYRIANYAGTLIDRGLEVGGLPAGADAFVQTSVANQVNLINTAGATINFWDGAAGPKFNGAVDGGDGIWQSGSGNDNWAEANGEVNAGYDDGAFAIFTGTAGTVRIDNGLGAVTASGLQFATDGYTITGDALTLTGPQSVIRVGDYTAGGAGYTATIASEIAGDTQLVKVDLGTLVLTGTNTYTGGTSIDGGIVQIASDANLGAATGGLRLNGGTLATSADVSSARAVELAGAGTFLTDAGTTLTLGGAITGAGSLTKSGGGILVLSGTGSYTGATSVGAGTLLVNGDYAQATGATSVASGASLGGTGTIGGDVTLADGATLTPGEGGAGTLTVGGNLSLAAGTTLAYEFGAANVSGGALNDLVNVGGDLVLDGTIEVTVSSGGTFDVGVYRVFNYGGTLIDNGLTLGTLPIGSDVTVQTSIAGQVNLVNAAGLTLGFWDGSAGPKNNGQIDGGSGTWQSGSGNDNWADASGDVNAAYSDGAFAVFGGTGGTVTVDNSLGQVTVAGMQFAADGYTIAGDGIAFTEPQSTIRVGDSSTAGAGFTATVNAALSGDTRLIKTDAGTLVLGGANSYTGGTLISGGTLQISADANLGAAAGDVTLDGGTLATSADMTSARDIVMAGAGTIAVASGTTFTFEGLLSGTGALTNAGAGTLLLTGDNSGFAGSTRVEGTMIVDGNLCGDVNVAEGGRLGGTGTICTTVNAGTIAPGNSIGTLTVAGTYTGMGGMLEIEAELGGDDSPTDRLVVTQGTAGSTEVVVINRGGLGAQTVEGIKIVDVTGGASDGVFALRGDYDFEGSPAVIAGAYGYRLFQGGVSTPTDGDWYLRSALLDGSGEPTGPLYQPGVPLYESYAQTLQTLNGLPTLQQRVGNRQWSGFTQGGVGMWARSEGARLRPEAAVSTSGTEVDTDTWGLQVGFDKALHDSTAGTLIAGVNGRYGNADARVHSPFGSGEIETQGFGVGATLTWYGSGGLYADAQAQLSWFASDLVSSVLGSLIDGSDGSGEAFSLEIGQRLPIGGSLSITPQAQIAYSNVAFDAFVDPHDAAVSTDEGESLRGRLGFSLDHEYSWAQQGGGTARNHVYGIVNLEYEMLDGSQVDVSGTPLLRRDHRLWGELGAGISHSWKDGRFTVFSEISVDTAMSDFGESNGLRGNAGFRMKF